MPGTAWSCAISPMMHSAWRPLSGSSSMVVVAGKPPGPGRECLDGMVLLNMPNVTAASERPLAPTVAPIVVTNSRRRRAPGWTSAGLLVIAIVAAANAWWYWRDNRVLPDLDRLSHWMRTGSTDRVEPILREHLLRSPHDAEARILLARALAGRGDLLGCRAAIA